MKTRSLILNGQLAAFWVQREVLGPVEHWHFVANGSSRGTELVSHKISHFGDTDFPSGFTSRCSCRCNG
jgi:hypothetical protein